MGGHVDRFVVRLVLALTVLSWAGVVGSEILDREPAEAVAPANARTETSPQQPAALSVPTNATPPEATQPPTARGG